MKFELVEFYPITEKNRGNLKKNAVGTLHIYAIDCQLDIRGIKVTQHGRSMYFHLPHLFGQDHETGEKVRFPVIRWTNETNHKEMMDFLHETVKPLIRKRLNPKLEK